MPLLIDPSRPGPDEEDLWNTISIPPAHKVLGTKADGRYPDVCHSVVLGMGCFWAAEQFFWQQAGVYTTAVGYSGGWTQEPSYDDVCTGQTGHAEVVLIVFDTSVVGLSKLLNLFWETHNPIQRSRGASVGADQYRSVIYTADVADMAVAMSSQDIYQADLNRAGLGQITTEIKVNPSFYFAEESHQQYLTKNREVVSELKGTGVPYSIKLG